MGCCSSSDSSSTNDNSRRELELTAVESKSNHKREPLRFDPKFKGPLESRSCTDILWLIIFIAFLVVWGYVGVFAVKRGDVDRVIVPSDSNGLRCGVDSEVLDKPYLVFYELSKCADPRVPLTGCNTPQVCVSNCPNQTFIYGETDKCDTRTFSQIRDKLICDIKVNKDRDIQECRHIDRLIDEHRCARWYLRGEPFLRRCLSDLLPSECPLIKSRKYTISSLPDFATSYNFGDSEGVSSRITFPEEKSRSKPLSKGEKKCESNRKLGKAIIVDKMQKVDTFLGRAFSNLFVWNNSTETVQVGQMVVEDVIETWRTMALALLIAMIVCLIFIAMMRWFAAPFVWLSIFGVIGLLGYGIVETYRRYIYLKNNPVERPPATTNISAFFEQYLVLKSTWLYFLIFLSIVTVIIIFIIICLRKRIVIAIALIKEGSKAVSAVTSTVFFPIFPWILQVIVIAFGVVIALYLTSIGDQVFRVSGLNSSTNCFCNQQYSDGDLCIAEEFNRNCRQSNGEICHDAACHFIKVENPTMVKWFIALNIFGLFWGVFFIEAFEEMVLAATFATWYWTFRKSQLPFFTLTRSVSRTIWYHLGTLAFGSFIIAVCRFIRVVLEYVDEKCKKYNNEITRAIFCMFRCLFWLLEKFLRFLNKNAYIMTAIHGTNFCTSAGDAFNLLARNFLRVLALDKVSEFLFFLSKLLISLGMGACMYTYLTSGYSHHDLHYNLVPTILVIIGTYLIACVFFSVYSMAVDTLFLCFLEDSERNDGTPEKPYFMSKELKSILGKKNMFNESEVA